MLEHLQTNTQSIYKLQLLLCLDISITYYPTDLEAVVLTEKKEK